MYFSDLDKVGYPVGTFKLGQKIYHIKDKEHRFPLENKIIGGVAYEEYSGK